MSRFQWRLSELSDEWFDYYEDAVFAAETEYDSRMANDEDLPYGDYNMTLGIGLYDTASIDPIRVYHTEIDVDYSHAPSDYDQHNVWHSGGGGVL